MRIIFLLSFLLLSGCAVLSKGGEAPNCPQIGFLNHAEAVEAETFHAEFGRLTGTCKATRKGDVRFDLILPFEVTKNSEGAALDTLDLPYFMAVLSPEGEVLQRTSFSTKVDFKGATAVTGAEEHRIYLPIRTGASAGDYRVLIGFALTPEQLKHNQEKK